MKTSIKLTFALIIMMTFGFISCKKNASVSELGKSAKIKSDIKPSTPDQEQQFTLGSELSPDETLLNVEATLNCNFARLVSSEENISKEYEFIFNPGINGLSSVSGAQIEEVYDIIKEELSKNALEAGVDYKLHLVDLLDLENNEWKVTAIFKDPLPEEDPQSALPWNISDEPIGYMAPQLGGDCNLSGFIGAPEKLSQYILHNAMVFNYGIQLGNFVANPITEYNAKYLIPIALRYDENAPQPWNSIGLREMVYNGPSTDWCITPTQLNYYYSKLFYSLIPYVLGNDQLINVKITSNQVYLGPPNFTAISIHNFNVTKGQYYASPTLPLNL